MTIGAGRRAFQRLKAQQFPSEATDDVTSESWSPDARRLMMQTHVEPAVGQFAAPARQRPPRVGVWLIAAAVAVMLLVVGAVAATRTSHPAGTPASPADQGLTTSQVLSDWEQALSKTPDPLIIVGYGSSTQIGNWEPNNGDNKMALLSRLATLAADVGATAPGPGTGTVSYPGGGKRTVDVLDAQETAQLLINDQGSPQPCDNCKPVVLTTPRHTTATVKTATGPATVPAWSFGVKGSTVRLVQNSVDPSELLSTVPGLPYGLGNAETTVHAEPDGRLTVRWTGAPSVAQAGGCGADYRPEFVEGSRVVVLRLVELPSSVTQTPEACPAVASGRTATVKPPHPLGSRVLVEDRSGFVVPRI
jgi:hypothetical protein